MNKKIIIAVVAVLLLVVVVIGTSTNYFGALKVGTIGTPTSTISVDIASAIGSSLIAGSDQEVYRFTVTATGKGDVRLGYISFDYAPTGLNLTGSNSLENSWFLKEHGKSTVLSTDVHAVSDVQVGLELDDSSTGKGIVIPAGTTKTFSLYADVYEDTDTSTSSAISIRVDSDYSNGTYTSTSVASVLGSYGDSLGLIWTNNYVMTGSTWYNGYGLDGDAFSSYLTLD